MHEDKGAGAVHRARGARADPGEPVRDGRQAPIGLVRLTVPSKRILDHRAVHLLGRPAGAGARGRALDRGDRGRGQRGAERGARAHRVREGEQPARAAAAGGRRGGDRHGGGHAAGGRLGHHDAAQGPREQRDRHDEHPRRVQRARDHGAQVRLQVLDPLLRLRAGRPGLLRRDDGPPARAAHADRARHPRGRGVGGRVRGHQPGRGRDDPALRQRARAPTCARRTSTCSRCPRCR